MHVTSHNAIACCLEFIILLKNQLSDNEVNKFKEYLLSIGDSLVCVADEELVKVHVHTNHPGLAFEKALTYGALTRMKIDNMREEHSERVLMEQERQRNVDQDEEFKKIKIARGINKKKESQKKYGFISVSVGEGMNKILKDIGIDFIIPGGQTMNPSTDEILSAIDEVNAENVFIFPNNKNIILAADQAASIAEGKNVFVVPSKTMPQGISAMVSFSTASTPEQNLTEMKNSMEGVKSGEVTYAIRDTSIEGKTIKKNDIMGISDNGIDVVGTDIADVTKKLVEDMVDDESGLISIYYGKDIDTHFGGQPIYYYIISVE